jgi:hypothetical protein
MTLLSGRLRLHNVDGSLCELSVCSKGHVDLERLCASIIRRKGDDLPPDRHEDCLAYLVAEGGVGPPSTSRQRTQTAEASETGSLTSSAPAPTRTGSAGTRAEPSGNSANYERSRPELLSLDVDDPNEIDWSTLSAESQATVRRIVWPLATGYSILEVARSVGISRSSVVRLVDELRDEIEQLSC